MLGTHAASLLVAALMPVLPAVAATAHVEFADPGKFSDAGRRYVPQERDDTLVMLRRHFVERAASSLPRDQNLDVIVTDVDLAGDFPRHGPNDVRVVKDIYPPAMELSFRLTGADGAVVKEGTRKLRDNGFLTGPARYLNDPLRYEKALIDDWIDREFIRPPKKE